MRQSNTPGNHKYQQLNKFANFKNTLIIEIQNF